MIAVTNDILSITLYRTLTINVPLSATQAFAWHLLPPFNCGLRICGELASCNKSCQVGGELAKAMSAERIFGSFSSDGFELMHTG